MGVRTKGKVEPHLEGLDTALSHIWKGLDMALHLDFNPKTVLVFSKERISFALLNNFL